MYKLARVVVTIYNPFLPAKVGKEKEMPTGIAFCKDATADVTTMVMDFANMVTDATGEITILDLVEALFRAVGVPEGAEANTNILNIFFFHGGQLISPELEEQLCQQFTERYNGWQVLIAPVVTPNWWANGQQV